MAKVLIKDGIILNEGVEFAGDILIKDQRIEKISPSIEDPNAEIINANGKWVMPGVIDDQVHFREPGLTQKANIFSESMAAAAGGVTSFMEMPNTKPPAFTQALLQDKYDIAKGSAWTNYSFYMGTSNDNIEEVLKTDQEQVCGVKIFMGSSTGNLLVDEPKTLEAIFSKVPMLIATHCEDEETVRRNEQWHIDKYGDDIPFHLHPIIRSREACYMSSKMAIELAKKADARLHILHISTKDETELFSPGNVIDKKITAEVCVHHLNFTEEQYHHLGSKIKCNPAIKSISDKEALWKALLDDRFDVIATDHAPHTLAEKNNPYTKAPSGLPLVQHSLLMMLDAVDEGRIPLLKVVQKMCHAPADLFRVRHRGYLREGYYADIVIVDRNKPYQVTKDNVLFKCGWSPLEGHTFNYTIDTTIINGKKVYEKGALFHHGVGMRLQFNPYS